MCNICGQPICSNPQYCKSRVPYCDQCVEDTRCVSPIDTQCIIYHFNTDTPTKLINLNFPNGTNLEVILEKIDALVGGINLPLSPVDTLTVKWTPGGTKGHQPKADVRISSLPNNHLSAKPDGLHVAQFNPDYFVKTDVTDVPGYLVTQVTGGTDGVVTNDVTDVNGLLEIKPRIDILAMFQRIRDLYADDFCELVSACQTTHPSPSGCTPVAFGPSNDLPDGIVGIPYTATINISGTQPYTITGITKPTWMTINIGPTGQTVEIRGTPDTADTDIPVDFTMGGCSGSTQAFATTIDVTATTTNPNPITGTFTFLYVPTEGGCSAAGYSGIQFVLDTPLNSPVTMRMAVRSTSNFGGAYHSCFDGAGTIIPGGQCNTIYNEQNPLLITIPAGVTSYTLPLMQYFNYDNLTWGSPPQYPPCNGNYNKVKVTDVWVQLQAPDAGITIALTNPNNVVSNFGATFTQVA